MPVESVGYIADLNPLYPTSIDSINQMDDHLRNIKKALVNTFPNIDKPVPLSTEELISLVPPGASVVFPAGLFTPIGWVVATDPNLLASAPQGFIYITKV